MRTRTIVTLSVVAATLVMSGCNSSSDSTTGGTLPAWVNSKTDINVSSGASAILEFIKGTDTLASPVGGGAGIMVAPSYADAVTFDEKSTAAIALIEAKQTPTERSSRRTAALQAPSMVAGYYSQEHNCTVSGNFTVTYDNGPWSTTGSFSSRTEVHNNCVDDGSTLDSYSSCAFFPLIGGTQATTNGSCGYISHYDSGYYDSSESYTAYKERWDDNVSEDVFIFSVNAEDSDLDNYSDDGSVETGVYTYTSKGYFEMHGVQGLGGDGEILFRNEATGYSEKVNYDTNMSTWNDIEVDITYNGYFASSVSENDANGTLVPVYGYGYYFQNLVNTESYIDENITKMTIDGKFGSACMGGTVTFTTLQTLVNDANTVVCLGDNFAMPKSGALTVSGNGEVTATFFEAVADSNNSDLNVSQGSESVVYDCWGDIPECGTTAL